MEEGQKDVAATKSSAYRQLLLLLMILGLSLLSVPAWAHTLTTDETIGATDYTYDGTDLVIDGATVEIAGEHTFISLTLINGAVLTHPVGYADGVTLNVAGTVEVDATSKIDVSGKGYGSDGPGGVVGLYSGASHGGRGGARDVYPVADPYGELTGPTSLGSGVETYNSNNRGGGALKLVADALVLDGNIYADGTSSTRVHNGGSSGGSVWLQLGMLSGAGSIYARGGSGWEDSDPRRSSSGGGGGRVAIHYGGLSAGFDLSTRVVASGGEAYHYHPAGAAGTVYLENTSAPHRLLRVDNNGTAGNRSYTDISGVVAEELQIRDSSVRLTGTASTFGLVSGESGYANIVVAPNALGGRLELSGSFLLETEVALDWTGTDVTLSDGVILSHVSGHVGGLQLTADTVAIDANSRIDISSRGYGSDGPGGVEGLYSGASHGGRGGTVGGGYSEPDPYGSPHEPTSLGSGVTTYDSSNRGGGALKLVADALVLDGNIYADGTSGTRVHNGGSSGGSVWLQLGMLSGAGSIYARGGSGWEDSDPRRSSSGGGGGRIAIHYGGLSGGFDLETRVVASGGVGYHYHPAGDPGTIHLQGSSVSTEIVVFSDFSDVSQLSLNGHASQYTSVDDGNIIRLARNVSGNGGTVFSKRDIYAGNFSTYFRFRITSPGGASDCESQRGADGLTFIVQSVDSSIGGGGGGMGYAGILNSMAVEFDTFCNSTHGETSSNHVAININGSVSQTDSGVVAVDVTPDFDDGDLWHAWVDYSGSTVEVRVNKSGLRPDVPLLTRDIDLISILGQESAYIGFGAATGGAWGNHDIVYWEYRNSYTPIGENIYIESSSLHSINESYINIDLWFNSPLLLDALNVDTFLFYTPLGSFPATSVLTLDSSDARSRGYRATLDHSTLGIAGFVEGDYRIEVGPFVSGLTSAADPVAMNQDGDEFVGEDPDDIYTSSFMLDLSPPAAPTVSNWVEGPTHLLATRTPQLLGGREDATEILSNGQVIVALGSGPWQRTLALPEGSSTLSLTARDAAGNVSEPLVLSFNADTTAPRVSGSQPAAGSFTNVALSSLVLDTNETNSGVDLAASTLSVLRDGAPVAGDWQVVGSQVHFIPQTPLADGLWQLGAQLADAAGNVGPTFTAQFTLDTEDPPAPALDPVPSYTGIAVLTVTGSKEAYAAVLINGSEVVSHTAAPTWSTTVDLVEGENVLSFVARDRAGNVSLPRGVVVQYDDQIPGLVALSGDGEGDGTRVVLEWHGYDEFTNGADIASYTVYQADAPYTSTTAAMAIATVPAGTQTYTVTGLQREQTYHFAVVAKDTAGLSHTTITSYPVTTVDTVAPPEVRQVAVEAFADRLVVTWQAPLDAPADLAGYRVYRDGDGGTDVALGTTQREITGLSPATGYALRVAARDGSENESTGLSLTGVTLLPNPTGVTPEPLDSKVALTWAGVSPSEYVKAYAIYAEETPFSDISTLTPRTQVGAGQTSAQVAGLTNGTDYYLAVATVNLNDGQTPVVSSVLATPQADETGPEISAVTLGGVPLADGVTVTTGGLLAVSATDPAGVNRVHFALADGSLLADDLNAADGFSTVWDLKTTTDGPHVLTVTAYDTLGNATVQTLNLTVDLAAPPAPVITAPADGHTTNQATVTVSGTAEADTEVRVIRGGAPIAGPIAVGPSGTFSLDVALDEGDNVLTAIASHRGGDSPASNPVTLSLDLSVPDAPLGLAAVAKPDGVVTLSWNTSGDERVVGYRVYRADTAFDTPAQAVIANATPVSGGRLDDLPGSDGTYHYRVAALNELGSESPLSNPVSAVSDSERPRALEIRYTPSGAYDIASGRMGPGTVAVAVTVNEPLLTTPFLSLAVDGGTPLSVALTAANDTEYRGSFTLTDEARSGTAYAVFSARDKVGNRGDVIEQGASAVFDTDGPTVTTLSVTPGEPIQNDQAAPVSLALALTLDQPVKLGSVPVLQYLLSGNGRPLSAVPTLLASDASRQHWTGNLTLPADAGLAHVETVHFTFQAEDDLGNVGSDIQGPDRYQVYQGDLPPLAIPAGLSAKALPGGQVQLTWQAVDDAVAYALYRQAPGEPGLTLLQRVTTLSHIDTTAIDGEHWYAVASVRAANTQEAISEFSTAVSVIADATVPGAPLNLSAELTSVGVRLLWAAAPDLGEEHVTYNVYRAGGTAIPDVTGLTPLQTYIGPNDQGLLGFIDGQPDKNTAAYVVTAVDDAGNESLPSNTDYLNIDLVPVANLAVRLETGHYPYLSWQHNGDNIQGYNVYLASDPHTPLNGVLLANGAYDDIGYTGGVRDYLITAVDTNDVESPARGITLIPVQATWDAANAVKRGIFNPVAVALTNPSPRLIEDLTVKVTLGGRTYPSTPVDLAPGETRSVPLVIGGRQSLADVAAYDLVVESITDTGERTQLLQQGQALIGQDTLLLTVEAQDLTRGTEGQVRFVLENTSAVQTEVLTAQPGGASPDIQLMLLDADENVLSSVPLSQSTGDGVITLPDRRRVARVPAGAIFRSAWAPLPIPAGAPDDIRVRIAVGQLHYGLGSAQQASIQGLAGQLTATLVDTAYVATLDDVSPAVAYGDEPIVLSGQALARGDHTPLPGMPVKLVIAGNGFERTKEVFTDNTGSYHYSHTPLAGESGVFTVSAIHPDLVTRPGQGSFTLGRVVVNLARLNLNVPKNYTHEIDAIRLRTGAASSASNARLVFDAADQPGGVIPEGVTLLPGAPVSLGAEQRVTLPFSLTADNTALEQGTLVLKVLSDETGSEPVGRIDVRYRFATAEPSLTFAPNHVETGVAHDKAATETITLENRGLAELLGMQLSLLNADGSPAPDWISLLSPAAQGELAVGERRAIQVRALPPSTVAEGNYAVKLRVEALNHEAVDINLFVAVTQSGLGNVLFKASDIFTATPGPDGQPIPGLAGARIRVQNEVVLSVEETLITDSEGDAYFTDLPAGRYRFRASATNHQDVLGGFIIKPGVTEQVEVFLDYDLITVEWSVTEITLEDRYEITLQAIFETDVPAAVVVLEPTSTQLPEMAPGDVFNGELRLTNYGLIRADDLSFQLPADDAYFRYEIIGGLPDTMDAKESLIVPYRVTALAPFAPDGSGSGGGCSGYATRMVTSYRYECTNGTTSGGSSSHTWSRPASGTSCGGGSSGGSSGGGSGRWWGYSGGGGPTGSGSPSYDSIPAAQCVPVPECPKEDRDCYPSGGSGGGQ